MTGMTWIIDTSFTGANTCTAGITHHDGVPALNIAADPRHGPEALWFRLRLRRLASTATAPWLLLRNVDVLLGGGDGSALQPVVRCERGPWQRLPRGIPMRHDDGRCDACWRLPDAAATIEVAFCMPYGDEELDELLADTRGSLHLQTIGSSEGGRPLFRLSNGDGSVDSQRPGLLIIARQHAGETPGSWVLDGLLRRIAELGAAAPLTWAIPYIDTDGVVEGAYGKDRHPVDFNRSWWTMGRRHEVHCAMRDVARWRARCAPRLCLDLHAPGACERSGCYVYASIGGGGQVPASCTAWSDRIARALGPRYAAADFTRIASYPSRWPRDTHPAFSTWAVEQQGLDALSLEISYQGNDEDTFSLEAYRDIGRRIADVLA
jgi:hypothetical protein